MIDYHRLGTPGYMASAINYRKYNFVFFLNSKTSIVLAADDSVVSWGPSPTYGELVSSAFIMYCNFSV